MSNVSRELIETLGPDGLVWWDSANCLGADADMFFSERGDATAKAKKICGACLVQVECLDFAVETVQRWGIWGGMTERERRPIRRARAIKVNRLAKATVAVTGARLE